ncbi:TPA: phage minor head protein [Haemophilus influenzae]|uniref:phage head morphogenesis protein n=1 Tax=Haemophilus influenzae TaxID=727 RepID=UPI0006969586|nr:phage minor head protein [Haemophilus influenzae]MCK9071916.1 phage minor head protein [Haemophilus influenzae]MCK9075615.1 phage minor head protein [Haemophilus influenzae]MCK9087583.1 phage minor head protein [Haemophilus influenzae]MCK9107200.1 phage minor head protein [Haemophilus influenzae]RFO86044.1 phage head morphogenesis protein [Haemophilus influenzae]
MLMNLPEILKNQKAKARKFKPVKMSKRTELWYRQQLKQFVKTMTDDVERALQQPQGSFFMDDAKGFQAISAKALMKVLEKYEKSDRTSQAENIANGFVGRGDAQNHAEVSTNLKNQTGIDLSAYLRNSPNIAERVNTLTAGNIQLIKSIRSQYLDKVQNAVMQAMVRGSLNKDLAAQIKDLGKTTEKRAMFIARDQSSKLNAALTQARHEEVGIKKYMWSASLDERVRESHAEKDGQIFEYSNPPADTGHPGHDFNCRCVQIPVFDEVQAKAKAQETLSEPVKENLMLSVDKLVEKSQKIEPTITADINNIATKAGGKLVGLENRLKSPSSIKRKIEAEVADGFSKSFSLNKIRDAIRYTTVFKEGDFVTRYKAMQYLLAIKGYKTIIVKNTWKNDSAYKGVNTFIQNEDGDVFEMQYHTQQSFDVKNGLLHKLYEQFRNPKTPFHEKEKLLLEMRKLSSKIKAPKGIELIEDKK